MILDRLSNADLYIPMHPRFAAAFQFLRTANWDTLADGEHELDGRRLYVSVASTPGRGRAAAKLESHRRYIDIQYVIRGTDDIGLMPVADCRQIELPYQESRDVALYLDKPINWVLVPSGSFTIFYPDDGHAPLGGTGEMRKAVVKVQLPD